MIVFSTFSIFSSILIVDKSNDSGEIGWVISKPLEEDNEWKDIEYFFSEYHVNKNKFYKSIYGTAKVSIPEYYVHISSSHSYCSGQIIRAGDSIEGLVLEENIRIKKIVDDTLIYERINQTSVSLCLFEKQVQGMISDARFTWFSKDYNLEYISSSYDSETNMFVLLFSLENGNGFFLNGMEGRIYATLNVDSDRDEGYYIPSDYIYEDDNGNYIMKYYFNNNEKKEKYKKVPIDVIVKDEDFCLVNGDDINDGNIIIKWLQSC